MRPFQLDNIGPMPEIIGCKVESDDFVLIYRFIVEEHEITCGLIWAKRRHIEWHTEPRTGFSLLLKRHLDTRK